MIIFLNTDNFVELDQFKDELTLVFINDATVSATLWNDATGVQIGGTIVMPYIAASEGKYRGTIGWDIVGLTNGLRVRLEIFADGGTGKRLTKVVRTVAKELSE